jgi:hypothetical protein
MLDLQITTEDKRNNPSILTWDIFLHTNQQKARCVWMEMRIGSYLSECQLQNHPFDYVLGLSTRVLIIQLSTNKVPKNQLKCTAIDAWYWYSSDILTLDQLFFSQFFNCHEPVSLFFNHTFSQLQFQHLDMN